MIFSADQTKQKDIFCEHCLYEKKKLRQRSTAKLVTSRIRCVMIVQNTTLDKKQVEITNYATT